MRKFLIVTAALGAAGFGVIKWTADDASSDERDARLVMNRVWCDHMPKSDRDTMNVFVALTQRPRQPPIGIFEEVSRWEGHFLAFVHEIVTHAPLSPEEQYAVATAYSQEPERA